jgi:hypothetical protein
MFCLAFDFLRNPALIHSLYNILEFLVYYMPSVLASSLSQEENVLDNMKLDSAINQLGVPL